MKHTLILLTAFSLLGLPVAAGAGEVPSGALDLGLHLEKGQTFRCTLRQESTQVLWFGTTEVERTESSETVSTLEVLAVDEKGVATVKVTTDRKASKSESESGVLEYDSEHPPDEVPWWELDSAAMIGRSYTVKVSPSGEILEIEGGDALRKVVADSLPEDETLRAQIADRAIKGVTDEALKESLWIVFPPGIHPGKPVAIGDSWAPEQPIPLEVMFVKNAYTLASRENGVATVTYEGPIEPDPDAEPIKEGPATIKVKMTGTVKGASRVDEKTGMVIESQADVALKGELLVTGMPNTEGEESIPQTTEATMTLTVE
jgi:hypothetical protein